MLEPVRHTRGERVVPALSFSLVALLILAPDYWTYHVLSTHSLVAGVSIVIVSYVAFSFVIWLLCIAARGIGLSWRRTPAATQRSNSAPRESGDVLRGGVDLDCRRQRPTGTRLRGCSGRAPRRRQASA
jgi:hypothetical protein